jgi:AraC family transcriptional regulator of arabinose operon
MKIGSIGYNYTHGAEFVMDCPNGPGSRLLLFIKTPSIFEIKGREYTVKKNSFVMLSPNTPCKYRGLDNVYTDDWMYFGAEEVDDELFQRLNIPFDEIIHIGNLEELSQLMHLMAYEHYSAECHHSEIEERYTEILFLKLSRILQSNAHISTVLIKERNHKFTQLRTRIYTMPESIHDIGKMADEVGMSRSGFQHLYKRMFRTSVMTDVINARINYAKRLLSSTNLTIKEIAEQCGYGSEFNFMRQFKSRCGKTPTEYRKTF